MANDIITVKVKNDKGAAIAAALDFVEPGGNITTGPGLPMPLPATGFTFTGDAGMQVRISAPGFASKTLNLTAGLNTITLAPASTAAAATQTAQTFFAKYKWVILIVVLLIAAYLAYRYKLIKL